MLEVYITDLSAYNKGYLLGEWVKLPMDYKELDKAIEKILKSASALCYMECGYYEEHEEIFITDYDWDDIKVFNVDEYDDVYQLNKQLELLEELSEYQLKCISYLMSQSLCKSVDEAIDKVDDVFIYENQTLEDVAYEMIQDTYRVEDYLANYIDYKKIANDMELEGCFYDDGTHVYEYMG